MVIRHTPFQCIISLLVFLKSNLDACWVLDSLEHSLKGRLVGLQREATLVHTHFEVIPCVRTVTAWRFTSSDAKSLDWESVDAADFSVGVLGGLAQSAAVVFDNWKVLADNDELVVLDHFYVFFLAVHPKEKEWF